jgi:hypothetical protein
MFLRIAITFLRNVGLKRSVVTFPSGALLTLWKIYLSLNMSLFCFDGVAPVRRREDAERNWNSGVKVQVADL